jgi:hypothetical protein
MSKYADNEYFRNGITEEILNALTKVKGLKVIARTSSFVFKGKKDEIDDMSFWMRLNTMFYTEKDSDYPSIAKIQVLIWTAITLTLFIYLSIKEGELWEVPNELVILMGISQATFLGRQQMAIQDVKKEVEKNDPNSK